MVFTLVLHLIRNPVVSPDAALPVALLRVDRRILAKRLWRAAAEDGTEFGFELEKPLQPGETVFQTERTRYVIAQTEEPVLEISLSMAPSAAAGIGWAIGNLHLELMSEPSRLLTPDEKSTRQLLARIGVAFRETKAVFRPGRFARGESNGPTEQTHELGASHKH